MGYGYYDTSALRMAMMVGLVSLIVGLVCIVLSIVSFWKIFKKAGIAGWKALIPVYNSYCVFKIAWGAKFFWINFVVICVWSIMNNLIRQAPSLIVSVLMLVSLIAIVAFHIALQINLAKAFGKSGGFAVGLILLPVIFDAILGFGSAVYVKNKMPAASGDESEYRW